MIFPLKPMPAIPVYDPTREHPHPGSFWFPRRFDVHSGIDLYAPMGTPVYAMEAGRVIQASWYTGENADSPWWRDTRAVYVKGESGIIVYGEIQEVVKEGNQVVAGQVIGYVVPVLKHWKGRPMSMLHMELYEKEWIGTLSAGESEESWIAHLKDPTDLFRGTGLDFLLDDPYAKEARTWSGGNRKCYEPALGSISDKTKSE